MREDNPEVWQQAMHEALIAMNRAVEAYQHLLKVVPFKEGGIPLAEITIHYKMEEPK